MKNVKGILLVLMGVALIVSGMCLRDQFGLGGEWLGGTLLIVAGLWPTEEEAAPKNRN